MKRIIIPLFLVLAASYSSVAQAILAMQDFDQVSTMTYTNTGGAMVTGSSGSGDRPANSAFYTSPVTAFGISNGTSSIEFSDITGLGSYTSKYFEFRLASWSVNSTGNGADGGDSVTASISLDGGATWSKEIQVGGNANACWHYTTGTGLASVVYDGNNSPQLFAPSGGGNRTTDGYSTVRILLADAVTQARIRIFMRNNHASELWTIDDVKLTGTPSAPLPLISASPSLLAGFIYVAGSGPSSSQHYALSGTDLTPSAGSLTVAGSLDFEVSSDSLTYGGSVSIPYSGGILVQTPVWVRLKTGLPPGSYNEVIDNSGGGAPAAGVSCSGTVTVAPAVYTWAGNDGGDWQAAANWLPPRVTPAADDILQFQNGTEQTIVNVPVQTIGQLSVSANTGITLECTGSAVLTIEGNAGEDLTVAAGSQLNLAGPDAMKVVLDTGATGHLSGEITLDEGAHRLMASDDSSLIFSSGSIFTSGSSFTGAPFGNTSANKNTVLFVPGSTYVSKGGSNPFGLSYPNSVVIFEGGSLYRHEQSGSLSLSGRSYADFELNYGGTFSPSGGNPCTMENLTVTQGTLNILLTASPFIITGDIYIGEGQALNFSPSQGIQISLEGTSGQTISGEGNLVVNNLSTLLIHNPGGVVLDKNATIDGNLEIDTGHFTIRPGRYLTVSGNTTLGTLDCLRISSDPTGTGSFIDHGITGTGTALAERYLKGGAWHFTCVPLTSTLTTVFSGLYATWFDEPGNRFRYILSLDSALTTQMLGYSLMPPGVDATAAFSGELNTGDKVIAVSRSYVPEGLGDFNGYNLVGNPYVSAVDLSVATPGWVNVEPTAWFWDDEAGNYRVYPAGAGACGTHSQFAQAMQGFFVHCTDTMATPTTPGLGQVTLTGEARVHSGEVFLKDFETVSSLLRVTATTDQGSFTDEISVYFNDISTPGYDPGQDAEKVDGNPDAPQLFTSCPGHRLTVNGQSMPPSGISVPMGFGTSVAGNVTLTATGAGSFDPDVSITLEDLKEGYSQDLKNSSEYSFDYTPGDPADRFVLHFSKPNIDTGAREGGEAPVIFYSQDKLCIDWHGMLGQPGNLTLFDLGGQEVFSWRTDGYERELARVTLAPGYYLASLVTDRISLHDKIYIP
jgi:filamentous hemagglutinin family protein